MSARSTFRRRLAFVVGCAVTYAVVAPAAAQTTTVEATSGAGAGISACRVEDVGAVIDATGARLRQHNAESQPRLRAKLREVAQRHGWTDADLQSKGLALLQDEDTTSLDDQAGELLMRLNELGDADRKDEVCKRLEDARIAASQLIEVTSERSAHVLARLDTALRDVAPSSSPGAAAQPGLSATPAPGATPPGPASPGAAAPSSPSRAEPRPQKQASASPVAPPPGAVPVPAPGSVAGAASPASPKPPRASAWSTETIREVEPEPAVIAELPRPIEPADLTFSPDDIQAAGRGFFGSLSAGLASVLNFAFTQYGRPTGYILGNEGGGAFLAGLRYGDGRLVMKVSGERKVFWQGPSVGYDFGIAGSQVMFLVYSVKDPQEMFTRFVGVDGSAYLVGGVGITFLKKGNIVLAPIRTGLGLRVGANIGYLKFTPEASLNPF